MLVFCFCFFAIESLKERSMKNNRVNGGRKEIRERGIWAGGRGDGGGGGRRVGGKLNILKYNRGSKKEEG